MPPPVYIVKPKNIFKHPFNKFDLDKVTNRESQNDDITDFFNYGFNEDTMNIYGKLVKRAIQVLDQSINPTYFDAPSQLMRLNDQIPMDFGGFCKFFDTSIFINSDLDPELQSQEMKNFANGNYLLRLFVYHTLYLKKSQYPLIDFVNLMYPPKQDEQNKTQLKKQQESEKNPILQVMEQIQINLQKKYQQMMKKLIQKKNNPGGTVTSGQAGETSVKQKKGNETEAPELSKSKKQGSKKQQQAQAKQEQDQSSQESESESDSQSESEDKKKKKKDKTKQGRSRSRSKKDKKSKSKRSKKDQRRSRSRSKNKNKDRKDKDRDRERERDRDRERRKQKSKKKSRDRDRSRQKRKDKGKKRRS